MREARGIHPLIIKGITDGKKTFCGPHTVQIDLTDRCNNNCIGCWIHSPSTEKRGLFANKKELPLRLVENLIGELHKLGTEKIILSGSGEPLMYPKIREVIKLIKSKGMILCIITNATLLNKDISDVLVESGVDLVTASIWAGSREAYIATHPGKDSYLFEKIKENLERLALCKKSHSSLLPQTKIYNVICSRNCCDIINMMNFAKEIDVDAVEFQVVDTIRGHTDFLALSGAQIKAVFDQFEKIKTSKDMVFYPIPQHQPVSKLATDEFIGSGMIWKNYKEGFRFSKYPPKLICPKGRQLEKKVTIEPLPFHRITEFQTYKYKFLPGEECASCGSDKICFGRRDEKAIEGDLLNLLGVGTFLRRLLSYQNESVYDSKINSLPCYIGWHYCRILSNGRVIPCCKASKFTLGNIYREGFTKIWNSSRYNTFRYNARRLSKKKPYFSKIDCLKGCDNWGMNAEIHIDVSKKESSAVIGPRQKDADNDAYVEIMTSDFISGNLSNKIIEFGEGLITDGGGGRGYAEYEFYINKEGIYKIYSRYACGTFRYVDIFIDNTLVKSNALSNCTGGWTSDYLKWNKEAEVELKNGRHILKISSNSYIPHIERFILTTEERELPGYASCAPAFKKILKKMKAGYLKARYLEMLGIYDGEYGYKGPFHVQIDLTNNCNNQCIACWCNSPLLKDKRLSPDKKREHLPAGLVKELLDEISAKGATEVYYSGSGEPFMHPQIMEILKYTKKKNLTCHVNTNFTLLDRDRLDCLIDMGVDFLTVSLWAATAETYVNTHIGRRADDFDRLKENIIYLNTHKKEKPFIKLYNVIFNMNYFEIEKMVDFAARTKSESLEFTLVDTVPEATDVLVLNKEELAGLRHSCDRIKENLDRRNRVKDNGVVIYQFDQFLRRISITDDAKEAKYDRNIIDKMPCYIGWLFARVVPNGEVHSCLKAHRIPTGSLYLNKFSEIWNSKRQVEFRKNTLTYVKESPFFRMIGNDPCTEDAGCYKSCDDIGRNKWMHGRMSMLSIPEKIALKSAAAALRIGRRITYKHMEEPSKKRTDHPIIAGIVHGRKAFCGPEQVVIDPTNRCNLRCISCWLYSPLLVKNRPSAEWLKEELPKETLIRLIDDLSSLGTKKIRFTGGGEPFMHSGLMDIIEHARKKNLLAAITTNFGLVSRDDIKSLIDLGLDELCVSIWASSGDIYSKVHPGVPPDYFEKLKSNLSYLKEIKEARPRVTFANVIMNSNAMDSEDMYEFGREYGADAIYFTVADIFNDQTDRLLLNNDERKALSAIAARIKSRSDDCGIKLEFFNGFLRRLAVPAVDFSQGEYDRNSIDTIPCYAGWIFSRVLADGSVAPCCRGARMPMGNIKEKSFKDIWFSEKYKEFRAKAKYLPKTDPFFKDIGCIKECDNLMHNETMHKMING